MALASKTALTGALEQAAQQAGMIITSAEESIGFGGLPTTSFQLALASDPSRATKLELSANFDLDRPELLPEMAVYLREAAQRLRNPRPDAYVTLAGLPLSLGEFQWPFHSSTSGADTYIVHGTAHLADGTDSPLHIKLAAAMTLTFAEVVPAPEQPYAESFIYNAVRKTLDQGQLEFLKSGNRQPIPVTTRYYSRKQNKFIFSDTTPSQRSEFIALKIYWLSGAIGGSAPIWIADPRDAQYVNSTVAELIPAALALESEGLAKGWDAGMWSATPKLMERKEQYEALLHHALDQTKPSFNEEMRGGHTNM